MGLKFDIVRVFLLLLQIYVLCGMNEIPYEKIPPYVIGNFIVCFIFVNLIFTDTVMPANKNATLRYRTIDNLLCSEEWSTIDDMTTACEKRISEECGRQATVSRVTIYKDIEFLSGLDGVKIEKTSSRPVKYRYARDSKTFNGTLVPSQSYADLESVSTHPGRSSVDSQVQCCLHGGQGH